jgi:hypothetical protein
VVLPHYHHRNAHIGGHICITCSVLFHVAAPLPLPCNKLMMMPNGDELKKSSYTMNTDVDPSTDLVEKSVVLSGGALMKSLGT